MAAPCPTCLKIRAEALSQVRRLAVLVKLKPKKGKK